jgi:ParB-like chromosome segregation protein Spo0J
MLCSLPIHFVRADLILPNECHHPQHAASLAATIRREQLWRIPVALERHSLAVMDGHHRLEAALQLRLMYVPCLLLDYDQVEVSASRQGYLVTPQEIVRRAKARELYPAKTTQHRFRSPLPTCNISVWLLQGQVASLFLHRQFELAHAAG